MKIYLVLVANYSEKTESLQWGFTSILVLIQHKAEEPVLGMELEEIGKMSR